jgi:hypothetical protein
VFINGFNDGQQEFSFFVSASDGQMDLIRTTENEDTSWDAIWESKAKITRVIVFCIIDEIELTNLISQM